MADAGPASLVRRATPADASALAALGERTFRDTYSADNTIEDMDAHVAATFAAARQLDEIDDPRLTMLVAEGDGELVGYCLVRRGDPPASVPRPAVEVARLYVAREAHGDGHGRRLLDAAVRLARSEDARAVWLGVWERNRRARAFYERAGFREVGETTYVLGADPQRDLVVQRDL